VTRLLKWARLGWYWLRSRYSSPNRFVACRTCPHWLVHSPIDARLPAAKLPQGGSQSLALKYVAGVCLKDVPRIFVDYTTGYALRVWTGADWCPRHPLYEKRILQGSGLEYRPGEQLTQVNAGFSRHPSFAEAVKLASGIKVQSSYSGIAPRSGIAASPEPDTLDKSSNQTSN